MVLLGLYQNSK